MAITLGDIHTALRELMDRGATAESIRWVADGQLLPLRERPTANAEDRSRGAALVMTWAEGLPPGTHLSTMCQLELVGMVTAAIADGRARERARTLAECRCPDLNANAHHPAP